MSDKRPNILHIFCDQLRFDAIHANGNPVIKTPNLDRLAGMGVNFTNAFTPSPVCVAARCSLITGKYPTKTHCISNDRMPDDMPSFMQILTENGYRTHGIGKCHFTPDGNALRGFQTRERQEECNPDKLENEPYYQMLCENGYDYTYEAHGVRGPMYYIPQPSRLPEKLHPTNWIGERAVDFIENNTEKPWYLFTSFIHPHPPFAPPVPWHKLYDPVQMPMPKWTNDDESMQMFINKAQNRYKYRDQGTDVNLLRCMKAYYYSCVSFIDYQVGRILDALEKSGQMDNTLIMFTSDHGELLGDYHSFGKRSQHDGPAHVPMFVYQKGVFEGGKVDDKPVSLVDAAPTFLEAAGIDPAPYGFDGVGMASGRHDYVYSFFSSIIEAQHYGFVNYLPEEIASDKELARQALGNYMITDGKWKYIYSAPDHKEFLFDRMTDCETHNRAYISGCKPQVKRLRAALINYMENNGLDRISENGEWKYFPPLDVVDDPDAGLITQDITCEWFDETLPGYTTDAVDKNGDVSWVDELQGRKA